MQKYVSIESNLKKSRLMFSYGLPVFLVLCFQDPFYRQIAPNLKRTFDFKSVGRDDA